MKVILEQRALLEKELEKISVVQRVYPSDANFLLVEVDDANALYRYLVESSVIVRNRHSVVHNCLRITVGTPNENQQLLTAIRNYSNQKI